MEEINKEKIESLFKIGTTEARLQYDELSSQLTEIIQNKLPETKLRQHQRVKIVTLPVGELITVPADAYVMTGINEDPVRLTSESYLPTFTIQMSRNETFRKVREEGTQVFIDMANSIVEVITKYEWEIYDKIIGAAKCSKMTIYIRKSFEANPDISLIRKQRVGIFGWQEMGVIGIKE
jgi:hypothetical protein